MSLGLGLLGWNDVIQCKRPSSLKKEPFVGCMSSTAAVQEFILWRLYSKTSTFLRENACIVITGKDNPLVERQPLKWVLGNINIIRAGDVPPQDSVQRIVDEVRKKRYRWVIIAPNGNSREIRSWKSDYYHIGNRLGWGFRVIGFDFSTRRLKVGPYVEHGMQLDDTQSILQSHMGDIVPLLVENSLVPIRDHDPKDVFFADKSTLLALLALLATSIVMVFSLREEAGRSAGDTIFHILVSLYGLYLQTNDDIVVNCAGLSIVYQHIPVIYMGFPRLPESVIVAGAMMGAIVGISKGESDVYIPFLYSALSKVPTYAKTLPEQCRVIATVVVISTVLNKLDV